VSLSVWVFSLLVFVASVECGSAYTYVKRDANSVVGGTNEVNAAEGANGVNGGSRVNATLRVAIVGAGAGGSSAAFWISKAAQRTGVNVSVDVFERNDYVGGRCKAVYPYNDNSTTLLETGPTVFVDANRNLMRATKVFNLTFRDFGKDYGGAETGVWDGNQFRVIFGPDEGIGSEKGIERYGADTLQRSGKLASKFVQSYLKLYTPMSPVWDNVKQLSDGLKLNTVITQTGAKYCNANRIGKTFAGEIIESVARGNYARNLDQIHAVDTLVCLVSDSSHGIQGGNSQLFERFLSESSARLHLKTEVKRLTKTKIKGKKQWAVTTSHSGRQTTQNYDHVILAAPIQDTGFKIRARPAHAFPNVHYVQLHVTLISTTTARPLNELFGGIPSVPQLILTTNEGAREGGKAPDFYSMSYRGTYDRGNGTEYAVRIFSRKKIDDAWLDKAFGKENIGWVYRKVWNAYPSSHPSPTYPPVKVDDGFWYANSIEPFISTMDTATLSSRNIVNLMFKEEFKSGVCGPDKTAGSGGWGGTGADGQIWGWDC
jgi:prenylcysteine oxidase/farnesylcysteine lyase